MINGELCPWNTNLLSILVASWSVSELPTRCSSCGRLLCGSLYKGGYISIVVPDIAGENRLLNRHLLAVIFASMQFLRAPPVSHLGHFLWFSTDKKLCAVLIGIVIFLLWKYWEQQFHTDLLPPRKNASLRHNADDVKYGCHMKTVKGERNTEVQYIDEL